ncbi:hypothetical protein BLNAU_10149 [Blattamonas nauphoetae]|uniref:Uncharacterized protein n=1 Tax=Blattamonas nauphoetae TaxID=2049346 RepID=A0ABQ9XTM0_9EUKA|nr:hypothetical protein BLNAU_10149 [Blattamonas nauphoetae]
MQRKQVNSCSIVPLPHSSPIVGVADPWHYAAQTGELLLDRRTFPQPNEIVAATDHSRAVTYTDSQNSSNDFISYQHHFVCSRKAIEITEGDDEEKLQRHEKREGGDENGVGGDEKGKEEMRMGKEEMRMGKEEMRMGKEEMRMGKEEMRMGKEEMRKGRRR